MHKYILAICTAVILIAGPSSALAASASSHPSPAALNNPLPAGLWDAFGDQSFGTFPAHNNGHNNPITIGGAPMVVNLDYNCTHRTVHGQSDVACEINYVNTNQCFNWYPAGDWVSLDSCVAGDNNELMLFDSNGPAGEYFIENVAADLAGANGVSYNYLTAFNDVFQCDGADSGETLYETGFVPNCAGNQWLWIS